MRFSNGVNITKISVFIYLTYMYFFALTKLIIVQSLKNIYIPNWWHLTNSLNYYHSSSLWQHTYLRTTNMIAFVSPFTGRNIWETKQAYTHVFFILKRNANVYLPEHVRKSSTTTAGEGTYTIWNCGSHIITAVRPSETWKILNNEDTCTERPGTGKVNTS